MCWATWLRCARTTTRVEGWVSICSCRHSGPDPGFPLRSRDGTAQSRTGFGKTFVTSALNVREYRVAKLNDAWTVQPHGPLEMVAEGIWSAEGSIAMPLGRFPRRMMIVVLASGGLAVWSPIPLREAEMARLDALGPVRFLIVPNAGHRLDIRAWKARYPEAGVIAPPGARDAVAEAVPVDATGNVLADPGVTLDRVEGTKADEFAMLVSREDGATLILNDILSSIRHPHGLGREYPGAIVRFWRQAPADSAPRPAALRGRSGRRGRPVPPMGRDTGSAARDRVARRYHFRAAGRSAAARRRGFAGVAIARGGRLKLAPPAVATPRLIRVPLSRGI